MEQNLHMLHEVDNSQICSDLNCGDEVDGTDLLSLPADVEVEFSSLPITEMERRLEVGQPVQNELVGYALYCIYARAKGFSVRKGNIERFHDGSGIRARDFVCSCEGNKDEKRSRLNIPASIRPTLRCKCKAKIRVARLKGQSWRVSAFKKEHSHDMFPPDQTYLLRSARHMSPEIEKCFEAMVKCGIPVARAKEFLQTLSQGGENVSQGGENVGFTQKHVSDSRANKQSRIGNDDEAQMVQHFIRMSNNEPYFYWNVEWDENNRLMNLFFRDYRCNIDYGYFGDVLLVDTTYRTTKYNLLCCPFVGINHHMENVMFGIAFMSDETESSFEWLFRTFLESMGGKQPITIFTDQCETMMKAIETIFPASHLRLGHWHINQSVLSHFGSLSDDSSFKSLWCKCMSGCQSEEEFEHTWKQMVDDYEIEDKKWFDLMYNLRHKWSTAFGCHIFSAGLMATSRSEGINVALKRNFGGAMSSLYDCIIDFEKVQESCRIDEKEKDTRSHHGRLPLGRNPWLIQIAELYTMELFTLFEEQLRESLDFAITEQHQVVGTSLLRFTLKSRGGTATVFSVQFDSQTLGINCSCHKFETFGILCSHILKVFDRVNMDSIPEMYIRSRWTKTVTNRVCDGLLVNDNSGAYGMEFVNDMMRRTYDLAQRAKSHNETKCILTESFEGAKSKLDVWFRNLSLDNMTTSGANGDFP
ncbi:hypothetical protein ACJIZ3_025096 [Penstemon smallii]|uniref:SWIM-type domain-containing protein n=1 Tax=Penstemon smallii TaxID=265156 RepID=A0ABD3TW86_9LAMI